MNAPHYTHGRVVWRELLTGDVARAKGFYGELFGWTFQDFPMGPGEPPYPIAMLEGEGIAGLTAKPDPRMPSFWASYVSVPDVDAAARAAAARGGAVAFGPADVPEVGRIAMIMDFDQAALGLLRSSRGDLPAAQPPVGGFCWETLSSSDPGRAREFYAAVCGWTTRPSAVAASLFAAGSRPEDEVADLQAAAGRPGSWLTYVLVGDLEAVGSRAARLGAEVVGGRIEVPSVGSIAVIADPTGARFGIFEAAAR